MTYRTVRPLGVSLALVLALLAAGAARAGEPAASPFPVPVIELNGSGADIGRDHAGALGGRIRTLHAKYLTAYFKNAAAKFLALGAAALFEPQFVPEHLAEVKALAAGTSIDPRQMLLAQCFLDLSPMVACSTVTLPAAAAPDGVARFGRNLDFPSFEVADKSSVVFVYRPAGRYQFASVAWPGMTGVLTGMNEHGLTLANMEVRRGARVPRAMPYTMLYRTVLERCRTVDEALTLLRDTPRQSANNLMLMDAAGARAVVELTPDAVAVRHADDGAALVSTNHQRDQDAATPGRCKRYDFLRDASGERFGRLDVGGVRSLLAGVKQRNTLQSMVFEPANRVMYLSVGKDATGGAYDRLDLAAYFRKAG